MLLRRTAPALLAVFALASIAEAHAVLVSSSPKDNSTIASAPKQITLVFDARIEKSVTQVTLLDARNKVVKLPSKPRARTAGAADRLIIPLPALKPGSYRLQYRVLATDGHLTPGMVRFRIVERKSK